MMIESRGYGHQSRLEHKDMDESFAHLLGQVSMSLTSRRAVRSVQLKYPVKGKLALLL